MPESQSRALKTRITA